MDLSLIQTDRSPRVPLVESALGQTSREHTLNFRCVPQDPGLVVLPAKVHGFCHEACLFIAHQQQRLRNSIVWSLPIWSSGICCFDKVTLCDNQADLAYVTATASTSYTVKWTGAL